MSKPRDKFEARPSDVTIVDPGDGGGAAPEMDAEQLFLTLAELREQAPDDAAYEAAAAALRAELEAGDGGD